MRRTPGIDAGAVPPSINFRADPETTFFGRLRRNGRAGTGPALVELTDSEGSLVVLDVNNG